MRKSSLYSCIYCLVLLESPMQGKLARRVWGRAEGKGLLISTSLAAYSTREEVVRNVPKGNALAAYFTTLPTGSARTGGTALKPSCAGSWGAPTQEKSFHGCCMQHSSRAIST